PLLGGECRTRADAVEDTAGAISDAAGELARFVAIEGAARRIGRVLRDMRELEGLAVVERGVPTAMMDDDRMLRRYLIQVVNVERTLILELRIVEEVSIDPCARRCRARLRLELADNARDRHELHLERIADEHLVEQRRP